MWNSSEVEIATNGKSLSKWSGQSICIDSRKIFSGDIFLALKGQNHDGHEFVDNAFSKGANAAIIEKEYYETYVNNNKLPLLVVDDSIKALNNLAIYNRKRLQSSIIAVTGSAGKTTTKEMLNLAFSGIGKCYASKGNYNNHLGMPISLASMDPINDFGVFELGMSNKNEISYLSKILRPNIGIITTVGAAHLESFNSIEEIAMAKAEILDGITEDGFIILNADNKYHDLIVRVAKTKKVKIINCGTNGDSKILEIKKDKNITYVKAQILDNIIKYRLNTDMEHLINNSVFALTAIAILNHDVQKAAENLINFKPLEGRGQKLSYKYKNTIFTVIDDSYNANPDSVRAALKELGKEKGRKIAILADMLELGNDAVKYHQNLLYEINSNNIDKVITYGKLMKELFQLLPNDKKFFHGENIHSIKNFLESNIIEGDIILIKGSFSTKIHKLIDYLDNL